MKLRDWHTRITAELAEAEPERERLFSQPKRQPPAQPPQTLDTVKLRKMLKGPSA